MPGGGGKDRERERERPISASHLVDEPTPDGSTSDEDASPAEKALAWANQAEALLLLRAHREREDAGTKLRHALIDFIKSRLGQVAMLVAVLVIGAIALQRSGIDPEVGRAYEAAAHYMTGCPVAAPPGPVPQPVPLALPGPVSPTH